MRILGVIQARMGSKRLPGKVLAKLNGKPLLLFLLERLKFSRRVDKFLVATSTLPEDDPIVDLLRDNGYQVFRGHHLDVLDRIYKASSLYGADFVVRITADNPLTDIGYMDEAVLIAVLSKADYVGIVGLPIGMACEVVSFRALKEAYLEAKAPYQREHVTPYINENPDRFKVVYIKAEEGLKELRLTVDYPEDLELLRRICKRIGDKSFWGLEDLKELFRNDPNLFLLNRDLPQRDKFDVDEGWGG